MAFEHELMDSGNLADKGSLLPSPLWSNFHGCTVLAECNIATAAAAVLLWLWLFQSDSIIKDLVLWLLNQTISLFDAVTQFISARIGPSSLLFFYRTSFKLQTLFF